MKVALPEMLRGELDGRLPADVIGALDWQARLGINFANPCAFQRACITHAPRCRIPGAWIRRLSAGVFPAFLHFLRLALGEQLVMLRDHVPRGAGIVHQLCDRVCALALHLRQRDNRRTQTCAR